MGTASNGQDCARQEDGSDCQRSSSQTPAEIARVPQPDTAASTTAPTPVSLTRGAMEKVDAIRYVIDRDTLLQVTLDIASSVVPIALSILWARATSTGMIAGIVGGCLCGMIVWLSYASQFEGGLAPEYFVKNTGEVKVMVDL